MAVWREAGVALRGTGVAAVGGAVGVEDGCGDAVVGAVVVVGWLGAGGGFFFASKNRCFTSRIENFLTVDSCQCYAAESTSAYLTGEQHSAGDS